MSQFASVSTQNMYDLGPTSMMAKRSRAAASKGFGNEKAFEFLNPYSTPRQNPAVGSLGAGAFGPAGRQAHMGFGPDFASDQFGVGDQMSQTRNLFRASSSGGGLVIGASNPFDENTITGTSGKGSRVQVVPGSEGTVSVRIRTNKGGEMTFDLSENAKINERPDGSLLVTMLDSNERYVITPDGTMEPSMETADNAGDDIYINIDGEMVNAGSGNDLIFNFANDATIMGGAGNDMIVLADRLTGLFIDSGDGDDTVNGKSVSSSTIHTGNGSDTVIFDSVSSDTTVDLGGGDNTADIHSLDGTLKAGQGNNTFNIGQALENAVIVAGSGKNTYLGSGGALLAKQDK